MEQEDAAEATQGEARSSQTGAERKTADGLFEDDDPPATIDPVSKQVKSLIWREQVLSRNDRVIRRSVGRLPDDRGTINVHLQALSDGMLDASSDLTPFSSGWTAAVAALRYPIPPRLKRRKKQYARAAHLQDGVAKFWIDEMRGDGGIAAFYQSWHALPPDMMVYRWPFLMLYFLRNAPASALLFLKRTISSTLPAGYQVADCLDLLAERLVLRSPSRGQVHWRLMGDLERQIGPRGLSEYSGFWSRRIYAVINLCLKRYAVAPPFTQSTLFSVCQQLQPPDILSAFEYWTSNNVRISPMTKLQFVTRMLEDEKISQREFKVSLDTVVKIQQEKPEIHRHDAFLFASARLLQVSRVAKNLDLDMEHTFKIIMQTGFPLHIELYNQLILRAWDVKAPEEAWRLYRAVGDHGLTPNAHTLTIMLTYMRRARDHERGMQLMSDVKAMPKLFSHPYIASAYMMTMITAADASWSGILDFYEKYYSLNRLKELGIVNETYARKPSSQKRAVAAPNQWLTALLIWAHAKLGADLTEVTVVTKKLIHLRDQGRPFFLELASLAMPWNVFIKKLADEGSPEEFEKWPLMLSDMTSSPRLHGFSKTIRGRMKRYRPPRPDALTWGIITHGLVSRGNFQAAEDVVKLMIKHGFTPTIHTWEALLSGYAKEQNLEGVVKTLRAMEVAGVTPTASTMTHMRKFEDQARLRQEFIASASRRQDPYSERSVEELFEISDEDLERLPDISPFPQESGPDE